MIDYLRYSFKKLKMNKCFTRVARENFPTGDLCPKWLPLYVILGT